MTLEAPQKPVTISLRAAPGLRQPSAGAPVLIETGSYILRSMRAEDANERILGWLNDAGMLQGLNLPPLHFTLETLRHFIVGFDNRRTYFIGIFDREAGILVGFYTLDTNLSHRIGHLTAGVGEQAYLGRRVFWDTVDALLDHMYAHRGLEKIKAQVLARNRRMLFNLINNNRRFIFEALLRQECLAPDGTRQDILIFASFRTPPPNMGIR